MDQTTIHVSFISPLTAHLCGAPDIRALRIRTGMCARTTNGPDHISFISPPSPSLRRTGHTRFARTYRCVRAHYKWTRPSPSHLPSLRRTGHMRNAFVCVRAHYTCEPAPLASPTSPRISAAHRYVRARAQMHQTKSMHRSISRSHSAAPRRHIPADHAALHPPRARALVVAHLEPQQELP